MSDNSEGYDEAMKRLLLNCDRRAVWLQPIARRYSIDAKDIGALISDVERKEELTVAYFWKGYLSNEQDQACIVQGILSREETLQVYSGMKIDVSDTSNA